MNKDTSIELAPNHKTGLALTNPVMPAAGCFGFGTEYAKLVEMERLGAVVVGPVTAGKRRGATPPRALPIPGGVLLHTGLANPGITAVVRRYVRAWARLPVPTIVHVAGTSPGETAACCRRLAGIEAVNGIELGLADNINPDDATDIIQAAHTTTNHPLIVRLPLRHANTLCEAVVEAGADALTVAAPPRGTAWYESGERFIRGRLYGPFVHPLALRAVRRVIEHASVPVIGCGGIYSDEDAKSFLRAGAVAIQVDGALWHDPSCLTRIALRLSSEIKPE
ncbi:MAG: dihydroorotate dehydrogenase [Chloroflexi bacterium]|nr:dihydroorotate dehydrogenase [Chloroflexota bacterium]